MARPPSGGFNEPTRILGGQSQYFAVVFDLTDADYEGYTFENAGNDDPQKIQEMRVGYQHKTAVKGVVQQFLERRFLRMKTALQRAVGSRRQGPLVQGPGEGPGVDDRRDCVRGRQQRRRSRARRRGRNRR